MKRNGLDEKRIDHSVYTYLEAKLLDATFGFAEILLGIGVSPLLSVEFVLQFADALLQFLDRLLTTFQSVRLGLVQAYLKLLDLGLERFAEFLLGLGVILLGSKLVGQSRGVHHRFLRFLLGVLRLVQQLVQIGLERNECRERGGRGGKRERENKRRIILTCRV